MRSSLKRVKDSAVFALLASVIFVTQYAMMGIPGVQLTGMFIAAITLTYRMRALIPIYVYILLFLLFHGFFPWNLPYLCVWLPLWGMFMLAGKIRASHKIKVPLFAVLCGLYGLSFGALYAPFWAFSAGLSFEQTVAWLISGLPADITHAVSNFAAGLLIVPLSELLKKLEKGRYNDA